MSSVLRPSSAGQSIALAALGCSSAIASQQQLPANPSSSEAAMPLAGHSLPVPDSAPRSHAASPAATAGQRAETTSHPVAALAASVPTASLPASTPQPKHRVAEVRQQQGVSQRTLARRLGMDVKAIQAMEQPDSDLSLSQLLALQAALDVPLIDLLEECPALSRPIAERAKMVKVMKTAVALREIKTNQRVERMAEMLCEQLIDVMPELAEVSGWPQFGSRRGISALGRVLSQPIDTTNLGLPD